MEPYTSSMPPPPGGIYTDLFTAIAAIQGHAKANVSALYKKTNLIVYSCDQYGKG
jgi:hypothetical protein